MKKKSIAPEGLYFYHVRNYACGYQLGENTSNAKEEKVTAVKSRGIKTPKVWELSTEFHW